MKPTLVTAKSECRIGDVVLKVKQTLDFKPSSENRTTLGKILEFRNVGGESVWMNMAEMGKEALTEWVSVSVWYDQYKAGLFNNSVKDEEVNNGVDNSDEVGSDDDYPF